MDRWLNAPPALAYVSEIHTWVVLNKYSEPISWTDEAKEIAWLSEWVGLRQEMRIGAAKTEFIAELKSFRNPISEWWQSINHRTPSSAGSRELAALGKMMCVIFYRAIAENTTIESSIGSSRSCKAGERKTELFALNRIVYGSW